MEEIKEILASMDTMLLNSQLDYSAIIPIASSVNKLDEFIYVDLCTYYKNFKFKINDQSRKV